MTLTILESGLSDAPSIVFLHGLGVSSWMWTDQINSLNETNHCLAIDLPGNGESHHSEWISMADSAAQVADIIREKATNGMAHVVGLSLGGYVGLHLLSEHPEVVETMIVSGVTTQPFERQWLVNPIIGLTKRMLRWGWFLRLSARSMQLPKDVEPLYERDGKRLSADTIQRVYGEVLRMEPPAKLAHNKRPLLVVAGEHEAELVLSTLPDLPTLTASALAATVPGAHHGWAGEAPELFTNMITRWTTKQIVPENFTIVAGELPTSPVV